MIPLRVWPGAALAALILIAKVIVPLVAPQAGVVGVLGGVLLGLAIGLWWLFFSRAPWVERLAVLALAAVAMYVTSRFIHVSIATAMMGFMFPVYAIPVVAIGLVAGAVATRRFGTARRRIVMAAAVVIASGALTLLKSEGVTATFENQFAWRWAKTAEDRLLAQAGDDPAPAPKPAPPTAAAETPAVTPAPVPAPGAAATAAAEAPAPVSGIASAEWPGFRGPARDGVARGVTIAADWKASPPAELWRRPVGPGWSSFAVRGDLIYTQEQRGEDEIVAAYQLKTGKPVWRHHDATRFWESMGGPGPRATPTLDGGRVYALGATGVLNALDAATGAVAWTRNAAADTGAQLPGWGFAGSPLVVEGLVIVATSGVLAAYDAQTGDRRWVGPEGNEGYTSPQFMTIEGVPQVVFLSGTGLVGVSLRDGKPLWQHEWRGAPIVQPSQTPDGNILIAINESSGVRRLAVTKGADGWRVEEKWTSNRLKPWFNDFVIHKGHAYGFDGTILACIDLADGARKWKGGRYGGGQLVLLPGQDAMLVVSEEGELAMVSATPDEFKELARVPAITGKTWNHPVIAGDVVLVRNGEEMAAFRVARR